MTRYLIDTNLLLRILEVEHPMHPIANNAVSRLLARGEHLAIVSQTIYETWNVCTRPIARNGLGLTLQETLAAVREVEQNFTLYPDVPELYQRWKELVERYQVRGVKVHDTRLVAACLVHGLTHILTFNVRDFKRFQEITVVHPEEIRYRAHE